MNFHSVKLRNIFCQNELCILDLDDRNKSYFLEVLPNLKRGLMQKEDQNILFPWKERILAKIKLVTTKVWKINVTWNVYEHILGLNKCKKVEEGNIIGVFLTQTINHRNFACVIFACETLLDIWNDFLSFSFISE